MGSNLVNPANFAVQADEFPDRAYFLCAGLASAQNQTRPQQQKRHFRIFYNCPDDRNRSFSLRHSNRPKTGTEGWRPRPGRAQWEYRQKEGSIIMDSWQIPPLFCCRLPVNHRDEVAGEIYEFKSEFVFLSLALPLSLLYRTNRFITPFHGRKSWVETSPHSS